MSFIKWLTLLLLSILSVQIMPGCSGCSQSGRSVKPDFSSPHSPEVRTMSASGNHGNINTIQMHLKNGVYFIPININGIEMEFIFDTGASIISISEVEVLFLWKQGKLDESDIRGTTRFSDATGTISEGTLINLREVQIGNKLLKNVEASVVHNMNAPLLLGQSALNRFGRVTIDYNRGTLTLE